MRVKQGYSSAIVEQLQKQWLCNVWRQNFRYRRLPKIAFLCSTVWEQMRKRWIFFPKFYLKNRSTIWLKIGSRTNFVNEQRCAEMGAFLGPAVCARWHLVADASNGIVQTYTLYHNTVQLHWNGVKTKECLITYYNE